MSRQLSHVAKPYCWQYEDMKRQFSQAQALIMSQGVNHSGDPDDGHGEATRLMGYSTAGLSPELSSHIRPYITNSDDVQGQNEHHVQPTPQTTAIDSEPTDISPSSNILQASDHISDALRFTETSDQGQIVGESSTEGLSRDSGPQSNWIVREDDFWWNQDPSLLGDVFGTGFFLLDEMDLHRPVG